MILWRPYSIEWLESKRTLLYLTRSCVREAGDAVEAIQHRVAGEQGDSIFDQELCKGGR